MESTAFRNIQEIILQNVFALQGLKMKVEKIKEIIIFVTFFMLISLLCTGVHCSNMQLRLAQFLKPFHWNLLLFLT